MHYKAFEVKYKTRIKLEALDYLLEQKEKQVVDFRQMISKLDGLGVSLIQATSYAVDNIDVGKLSKNYSEKNASPVK